MGEDEQTDAELVKETLAGNREAFGCLYRRYVRMVRAVVNGVAQDSPLAHDLVQETLVLAFRDVPPPPLAKPEASVAATTFPARLTRFTASRVSHDRSPCQSRSLASTGVGRFTAKIYCHHI